MAHRQDLSNLADRFAGEVLYRRAERFLQLGKNALIDEFEFLEDSHSARTEPSFRTPAVAYRNANTAIGNGHAEQPLRP